jgi:hypothetical protein
MYACSAEGSFDTVIGLFWHCNDLLIVIQGIYNLNYYY